MKTFLFVFLFFLTLPSQAKYPSWKNWLGHWKRIDTSYYTSASIEFQSKNNILSFSLDAINGANMGKIGGELKFIEPQKAIFKENGFSDQDCLVTLQKKDDLINVSTENCDAHGGAGVFYDGAYKKYNPKTEKETLDTLTKQGIFPNSKKEEIFKNLVKEKYQIFLENTQHVFDETSSKNPKRKVFRTGVRGVFTFMENIIIYDDQKNIWAATLVTENETSPTKIYYFTNVKTDKKKLPKEIEHWRSRFQKYKVIFASSKSSS